MWVTEYGKKPSILIIDDELSSVMIAEKAVSELGTVYTTTEPQNAFELARQLQPDVILLDIEMGAYNGLQLCQDLKLDPVTAGSAVIFITSHRDPNIEYFSLRFGGVDFINKPIDMKICQLRVRNQLAILLYQRRLEKTTEALHQEKEALHVTLNSIGDAVIASDANGIVTFMNPIAERMTGWAQRDAIGQHIEQVMELRDATTQKPSLNPLMLALKEQRIVGMALNCQLHSLDGQIYRVEDSAAPIRNTNQEVIGAIIVFHDISEAVAMSVKMTHLANNDQLTGLPNRVLLHDRLEFAIKRSLNADKYTALLLIDIDHFKYLNDTLGHYLGDILIKQVAKRLESHIDPSATLARVGGDEFVLVLGDVNSVSFVAGVASNLVASFNEPFLLEQHEYQISVSIGVSMNPLDAYEEEAMMRHADVAMYRAKKQGRNRVCFFSEELEHDLIKRHKVEKILRDSLEQNSLEVHYQPQVDLNTGKIIGLEALVRLKAEEQGWISPLDFIPLAEDLVLINQLGGQVLRKACKFAKRLVEMNAPIKMSVNISAVQFASPNFVSDIADCLEECSLPSRYLELEVTESALMHDFEETQVILTELSQMGISIAIDDFGTGYSSLSYLKAFPVDVLKIDQSFVKDMMQDSQSLDIVKTIIFLANSLSLTLVGEGVETSDQADTLQQLGCLIVQGYLIAKPEPEQTILTRLC
ncbi:EAL domain-containing protein [Pseudoalteromonas fenneropenaei]|uniref:EAL domain-containing protein n=1 Tax=Pseudoalteromonas fenneropenaei TaxID=1737459 RepID=A0ABV7CI65_9GAMM